MCVRFHTSLGSNKINPEELPNTYVVGCDDTISSSKFDNSETNSINMPLFLKYDMNMLHFKLKH